MPSSENESCTVPPPADHVIPYLCGGPIVEQSLCESVLRPNFTSFASDQSPGTDYIGYPETPHFVVQCVWNALTHMCEDGPMCTVAFPPRSPPPMLPPTPPPLAEWWEKMQWWGWLLIAFAVVLVGWVCKCCCDQNEKDNERKFEQQRRKEETYRNTGMGYGSQYGSPSFLRLSVREL